jgi:phosphatidylglycerophosphate synthase
MGNNIKHGIGEDNAVIRGVVSLLAIFPANAWTTLRLLGVYWLVTAYHQGFITVLMVFLLLLLTDFIDGKVARLRNNNLFEWLDPFWWLYKARIISYHAWTRVGKWYDPMVDKVFILGAFYYYGVVYLNILPAWIFWTLFVLELSGRLIIIPMARKKLGKSLTVPANFWGKWKFFAEAMTGLMILIANFNRTIDWHQPVLVMSLIVLVLSIYSIVNYIFEFHDPWHKS